MKFVKKFKKWSLIIASVFLLGGLAFAVHSIVFLVSSETVEGTITEIRESYGENGTSYFPTVEFFVDGEHYAFESIAGSRTSFIGQEVPVKYKASDPTDTARMATVWGLWAGAIIFASMALLTFMVYLIMTNHIRVRLKFIKRMRSTGARVDATVTRIYDKQIRASNSGVTITRTVFLIEARGQYNGEERTFTSDNFMVDPYDFGLREGHTIPVYVDPQKPKKYFVDAVDVVGEEHVN